MQLTENFYKEEFDCRDGSKMPEEILTNIKILASNLQFIRNELNEPIFISSGYRSAEHNEKVGGKSNSYHLRGMAADLVSKNFSPKELATIILKLKEENIILKGGIGLYDGFVHYDIRGDLVHWNESSRFKDII